MIAGASSTNQAGVTGPVVVYSATDGELVKPNAFTYNEPTISVLGTNGVVMGNDAAAQLANGSDFGHWLVGNEVSHTFRITNSGSSALGITGWTTNGAGAAQFRVSGLPSSVAISSVVSFTVAYVPTAAGSHEAALLIANDSPTGVYTVNVAGSCAQLSSDSGPYSGGNTLTVTNGYLGTITNVLVGNVRVAPTASGANWFTLTLPAASATGRVHLVVQTSDHGAITLANAYTYNATGSIRSLEADWMQWEQVAGLPAVRCNHAAAVMDGSLYVIGGQSGGLGTQVTNVYRFSGTNWTPVAGLPRTVAEMGAGVLGSNLYSVGGYCTVGMSSANTNAVYSYNGTRWTNAPVVPNWIRNMGVATLGSTLYAFACRADGNQITNVYAYNGTAWSQAASMPTNVSSTANGLLNGQILVAGGVRSVETKTNVYLFDGSIWTQTKGLPTNRGYWAGATLDGAFYAVGGSFTIQVSPYTTTYYTNMYRFDGTNWTEVAGLPVARALHTASVLSNQLYIVGGTDGTLRTNVYRYPVYAPGSGVSPSSGSWTGGYPMIIRGSNLGNGDITNVTVCGASVASIGSQSATQIVVTVGQAIEGGLGDVRVYSVSIGMTVRSNAFTYTGPGLRITGLNGAALVNGAAADRANGTYFRPMLSGEVVTNTFAITNGGTAARNSLAHFG